MTAYGVALMRPRKLIVVEARSKKAAVAAVAERFGAAVYDASGYGGGALREEMRVDETPLAAGEYDIEAVPEDGGGFGSDPNPPVTPYTEHRGISQGIGWDEGGAMTSRGAAYDVDISGGGEPLRIKARGAGGRFRG